MSIYLISDTHFGDEAIIRYEKWPFKDSHDYMDTFIHTWNQTIMPEDEIYHLGDVSSLAKEKTKDILDRLCGHKYLVMGNHDRHLSIMDWHDIGFERVYDHPILIDGFVLLSHEPLYMTLNMPYINIFGHVHGNPIYKDVSPCGCCVCGERNNWTPQLYDSVCSLIKMQRNNLAGSII